jgi:O-antigen/teichoic acid export membrane protein
LGKRPKGLGRTAGFAWSEIPRQAVAVGQKSATLILALTLANASNYLFNVVASRSLGARAYGGLGSILAVMLVLGVPLGAVQATFATRIAQRPRHTHDDVLARSIAVLKAATPFGLAAAAAIAIASPLLTRFLHLGSVAVPAALALYLVPALFASILRGGLQGAMRFKALAVASALPFGVRLAVGVAALEMGAGVVGAVMASVTAEVAGVVVALLLMKPAAPRHPIRADRAAAKSLLRDARPVALGLAAVWCLIELDLVLARHFLPAGETGRYAAAGLLARAVLFVPGAVSLVALPHFAAHESRGPVAYRWLLGSSAAVVGVGAFVAAVLAILREPIVSFTFGAEYVRAASLLPLMCLTMVGFALVNVLVNFFIAGGSRVHLLLWLSVGCLWVAVWRFHGSATGIVVVTAVCAWASAAIGLLVARSSAIGRAPLDRLPKELHYSWDRGGPEREPELSLIIPTHEVGAPLLRTVATLARHLRSSGFRYEVIVVSDGSTTRLEGDLQRVDECVEIVHYVPRQGKGVALRVGLVRARGRHVAFLDGDGDLDPAALGEFLSLVARDDPDLVIGSKRHPDSLVDYPASRRVMSWVYQRIVRLLFGLDVTDTQTGMKLVRRDVLDAVLPRMVEKRFAFDLEFLVVARRLGYTRVVEAPVHLNYQFSSTVDARAVMKILLDTAVIFYRRYISRFYDDSRRVPLETAVDKAGTFSPEM